MTARRSEGRWMRIAAPRPPRLRWPAWRSPTRDHQENAQHLPETIAARPDRGRLRPLRTARCVAVLLEGKGPTSPQEHYREEYRRAGRKGQEERGLFLPFPVISSR